MKTLSCVCLPDKNSSLKIEEISKKISTECESKNALSFPPHFSIRGDFKISEEDIPKMTEEIKNFCKEIELPEIKLSDYGFYPWRLVFLNIKKDAVLQNLHDRCMGSISKYKSDWIPEQYKNNNFEGKQKRYIKEHGYHFCFEFFSPHFTVAGNDMSEENFQKIKKALRKKQEDLEVKIEKLVFFDRDNNNRKIIEIPLKNI